MTIPQHKWRWSGLCLLLLALTVHADSHDLEAQQKVESLRCGNTTLALRMADQAQVQSRRDLGWRFYSGDNYIDVERAMRVSKSMETRYRWRVWSNGKIEAISAPAQQLCE